MIRNYIATLRAYLSHVSQYCLRCRRYILGPHRMNTAAIDSDRYKQIRRLALVTSQAFSIPNFRGPLVRAWHARGIRVFALAPDYDQSLRTAVRALGAEPVDFPLARTGLNPLQDLRSLLALRGVLGRLQVDACFSYFIKPVTYGNLAARLAGVRRRFSIVEGAGYVFADAAAGSLRRRLLRRAVSLLYRVGLDGAERVFFLNRDDVELFVGEGLVNPEQVVLIGGIGVDLAYFTPSPRVISPPVFLLAARLLAEKGVREYVAAARRLHGLAQFILLGGPDPNPGSIRRDELEQWAREGMVEWHDHVADVRPLIARASVFVLPSYYREGLPRSIQEAMAMARPIITTDMPGCRDTVVPGENGFLVPPRDVDALVAAMRRFIDEPGLVRRMGAASRRLAEERFDVERCNARVLAAMGLTAGLTGEQRIQDVRQ